MSCRPVSEEDLHAYVDQLLEPERQAKIAAYLEDHPDAARRVVDYSAQRELLRSTLALTADEHLPPQFNAWQIVGDRHRKRFSPFGWRIAAMLLISLGSIGGWVARSAMEGAPGELAALAQEAATCFEVYAQDRVRPVELRVSESEQLVQWLSNRLQQTIKVPDLATEGYRLLGGRLIATLHGPAAMFMYDDDRGDRLVVLTQPLTILHEESMTPQWSGEVAGFTWADRGMGYSIVGPSALDSLRLIAKDVRRQAHEI
jgi:anti-sigma factor RsiW